MLNKRKNANAQKINGSIKKSRLVWPFSLNSYLTLLLVWFVIMLLDLALGIRCDYFIWPIAICGKSLLDRYTGSGLKSTFFYLGTILVSSFLAFLWISDTYLGIVSRICSWLHLVIHCGGGSVLTSTLLCFFFSYIELFLYHREFKPSTFHEYCKPLAWISVGYLYLLICEYLVERIRLYLRTRTRRNVESQNASYYCLLETALPEELWCYFHRTLRNSSKCLKAISRGNLNSAADVALANVKKTSSQQPVKKREYELLSDSGGSSSSPCNSRRSSPENDIFQNATGTSNAISNRRFQSAVAMKNVSGGGAVSSNNTNGTSGGAANYQSSSPDEANAQPRTTGNTNHGSSSSSSGAGTPGGGGGGGGEKKGSGAGGGGGGGISSNKSNAAKSAKDETTRKLETESRRLRSELQSLRSIEADLRSQMTQKAATERASRAELDQVKSDFETLTSRLHTITERVETDRKNLQKAEERLTTERKLRLELEQQMTDLRNTSASILGPNSALLYDVPPSQQPSQQNGEENCACDTTTVTKATAKSAANNTCLARMKKLEGELKAMNQELASKDSQITTLKQQQQNQSTMVSTTISVAAATGMDALAPGNAGKISAATVAVASLAVGAAITPGMSEQFQIRRTEFQQQELANLNQELHRLRSALSEEEDNRNKINQAYIESLRKVTTLESILTEKEFEITHLSMQLDKLTPAYYNFLNPRGGSIVDSSSSPPPAACAGGGSVHLDVQPLTNGEVHHHHAHHGHHGLSSVMDDSLIDSYYNTNPNMRMRQLPQQGNKPSQPTAQQQSQQQQHHSSGSAFFATMSPFITGGGGGGRVTANNTSSQYDSITGGQFANDSAEIMLYHNNSSSSNNNGYPGMHGRQASPPMASSWFGHGVTGASLGGSGAGSNKFYSNGQSAGVVAEDYNMMRPPSPSNFLVSGSAGRSRLVNNCFAKISQQKQQHDSMSLSSGNMNFGAPGSGIPRTSGLLFTLGDQDEHGSKNTTPPLSDLPLVGGEDEELTQLLHSNHQSGLDDLNYYALIDDDQIVNWSRQNSAGRFGQAVGQTVAADSSGAPNTSSVFDDLNALD